MNKPRSEERELKKALVAAGRAIKGTPHKGARKPEPMASETETPQKADAPEPTPMRQPWPGEALF